MTDPVHQFLIAASVPRDTGHRSGTLEEAESIRSTHPEIEESSIYTACVLGDVATVRRWVERAPAIATAVGGPHHWDPLTYLCFSRYLRLDGSRSTEFVTTARTLLDAGASPNTGWFDANHQPKPAWESVLYGAAGIAQHVELTRLLLERGADPNDEETPCHVPETDDNSVLQVLLDSQKLNAESLAILLVRKADWHDHDGVKLLLENGADVNYVTQWNITPLQQSLRRENALASIEHMLDHGGDPLFSLASGDHPPVTLAARSGRRDVLELLARRGVPVELLGADGLIAACAMNDEAAVQSMAAESTDVVREVIADGGSLIAKFAGVGNAAGLGLLLSLGVPITATFVAGDAYWDIAPNSTALHVAAWRLRHQTVRYLVEHGAPVNVQDGRGRTPLALAVRGCVDSYWTERRSPESVAILLRAGATTDGVLIPSGYEDVDRLLSQSGAMARLSE